MSGPSISKPWFEPDHRSYLDAPIINMTPAEYTTDMAFTGITSYFIVLIWKNCRSALGLIKYKKERLLYILPACAAAWSEASQLERNVGFSGPVYRACKSTNQTKLLADFSCIQRGVYCTKNPIYEFPKMKLHAAQFLHSCICKRFIYF